MAPNSKRTAETTFEKVANKILGPMPASDSESLPPPAKKPCHRGRGRKNVKTVDSDDDGGLAVAAQVKISYTISIYSPSQMKKAAKKRGDPKTTLLQLAADTVWDTFKAKLLIKIDGILNPPMISFNHYEVQFSIPRKHPQATELNADAFDFMISRVLQCKEPSANILVEPIVVAKSSRKKDDDTHDKSSDSESGSDSDNAKSKKGKKGKKKDPKDLPGNKAVNRKAEQLRERYACNDNACDGSACYPHPDDRRHLRLSDTHLDVWASAILKGDDTATIEKPPNHKVFDFLPDHAKGKPSPLLQRRIAAQTAPNQPAPAPAPIIIQIPNFGGPQLGPAPAYTPVPPAPIPSTNEPLYPSNLRPSPPLFLEEFCKNYNLDDVVLSRFKEQRFRTLNELCYLTLGHLEQMEFAMGDIAAIQDAIATWQSDLQRV